MHDWICNLQKLYIIFQIVLIYKAELFWSSFIYRKSQLHQAAGIVETYTINV